MEEVARGLERRAEASLRLAEDNAVRFETTKAEAILLSMRRSHGHRQTKKERKCG